MASHCHAYAVNAPGGRRQVGFLNVLLTEKRVGKRGRFYFGGRGFAPFTARSQKSSDGVQVLSSTVELKRAQTQSAGNAGCVISMKVLPSYD